VSHLGHVPAAVELLAESGPVEQLSLPLEKRRCQDAGGGDSGLRLSLALCGGLVRQSVVRMREDAFEPGTALSGRQDAKPRLLADPDDLVEQADQVGRGLVGQGHGPVIG
jgi:hypothetical protein